MFRGLILALAAAAAFATATAVMVVALAFALYAVVSPQLGSAGAAGTVAGACALLVLVLAVGLGQAVRRQRAKLAAAPAKIAKQFMTAVRERPVAAIASAVSAGILWLGNPKNFASILATVSASGKRRKAK